MEPARSPAEVVHYRLVAVGFDGSGRTTRRAVRSAKPAYLAGRRRTYGPWNIEPGMWLEFDSGAGPTLSSPCDIRHLRSTVLGAEGASATLGLLRPADDASGALVYVGPTSGSDDIARYRAANATVGTVGGAVVVREVGGPMSKMSADLPNRDTDTVRDLTVRWRVRSRARWGGLAGAVLRALAGCTIGTHLPTPDPVKSQRAAEAVAEAGAGQDWYRAIELVNGRPPVAVVQPDGEASSSPVPNGVGYVCLVPGVEADSDTGHRVCAAVRAAIGQLRPPILVTTLTVIGRSSSYDC